MAPPHAGGVFHHAGTEAGLPGPEPRRGSYGSFLSFSDPDDNGRFLQEVTTRLPGRVDPSTTAFASADEPAGALRRAAAAHREQGPGRGLEDSGWAEWFARYLVRERTGAGEP